MTRVNIHASCLVVARAGEALAAPADWGVLLLGESGSGKSAVLLELIARGARLVADDRVELFVHEDALWAAPPRALAGLLEARGLGIVKLPHVVKARVRLAVRLVEDEERLPMPRAWAPPATLGLPPDAHPPLVEFAPAHASSKVLLAASAYSNALFRDQGNPL